MLLYGGVNNTGDLSDFWEWDGTAWHAVAATGPGPRAGHRMAFDAAHGKVHLFGGDSTDHRDWTWDGSRWEPVEGSAPTWRSLPAMAYDAARGRIVLFGGYAGQVNLADTWEFVDDRWMQVGATASSAFGRAAKWLPELTGSGQNRER